MNGLSSLLSNDLQRGYEAGLASLVPPRRMADGGSNKPYVYKYDPKTQTYTLVEEQTPAANIAAGKPADFKFYEDGPDTGPLPPTPTPFGSGKGGDKGDGESSTSQQGGGKGGLSDIMDNLTNAVQQFADFQGKGGVVGAIARGLGDMFGLTAPGAPFGPPGPGETAGITGDAALALGGYGLGIDPEAGGIDAPSVGPSVFGGGLSPVDASYLPDYGTSVIAKGGVVRAAKGMSMEDNSFVLPADVVAAMGNGSSQAGLQALRNNMGPEVQMIRGDGDGMSDSIPANIAGTQPALISDGEAYVPPGVVRAMGGGDMSKGAKNLYAVMDEARKQAYGRTQQANQIDPNKVMAKAMKA